MPGTLHMHFASAKWHMPDYVHFAPAKCIRRRAVRRSTLKGAQPPWAGNYVLVCIRTLAGFLKTFPSFMPTNMPIFLFSDRSASLCVMIPSKTIE